MYNVSPFVYCKFMQFVSALFFKTLCMKLKYKLNYALWLFWQSKLVDLCCVLIILITASAILYKVKFIELIRR